MLTLVDRGGTFTDVVRIASDGTVSIEKIPSDQAVIGALTDGPLRFGTTVATNALLERTGRRTLALVTEGLEGLAKIGDMTRPDLFDPDVCRQPPLCTHSVGIAGRIDANGVEVEPLVLPDPSVLEGYDAVAIALINSHRDPAHEQAVADWVAEHAPDCFVALGHRVVPELGLLERLETTLVHAAITPVLRDALHRDAIPDAALAMRSDGSLCPAPQLIAPDAVLSGPAGGVLAVAHIARRAGFSQAVGLDMGGTSTDVCRIDGALPRRTGRVEVAGIHLLRSILAVDTIAAGGGSILWSDGTRIGVGPRSAGADPGPQCYGRGGPPTLTDAALALGLLDAQAFDPPLDPSRIALPAEAQSFVELAREQMTAAVRRLALADGADLRTHALVAYGGAAGQHAAAVAERLGIRTVLIHPCASVLSAWGQALARREESALIDLHLPIERWQAVLDALARLRSQLPSLGEREAELVLRYVGTDGAIRLPLLDSPTAMTDRFRSEHLNRFGYNRDAPIEVCTVHLRSLGPRIELPEDPALSLSGDTVLHLGTTSVNVPPGWSAEAVDGLLRLTHSDAPTPLAPTQRSPAGVALWSARFMAIAEQGGAVLQRVARSVNIRERLDFSCAVFDSAGFLIANAPHIPVHLGAMGLTVRALIASVAPRPGTHWLCNDPAAGGSHLPDLTVISVARLGDRPVYVASRAHHVDVGGSTPGSMSPHSTRLADEGVVFRDVQLHEDGSGPDLGGCRQPDTLRADLAAQVAANRSMLDGLTALGNPVAVHTWMAHLLDASEQLTTALIARLPAQAVAVSDTLRGLPIHASIRVEEEVLVVDFSGTGGPDPGNLNAPIAVVRAAVLYAVRVLLDTDLPLNEGVMRRVRILLPRPSLLAPPPGAAVVGGNVETSMRLADLLLRATGRAAASAGTMNNLTLGGEGWSFYETLGGGQGGTNRGPGASARQLHMTNTRATDPEVLEHRLPLRVREFRVRRGSGGSGEHPGGDGLVRVIEVLVPCTAALLATRRESGAVGLGGEAGAPGQDYLIRDGVAQSWSGEPTALGPGDRVRIETPGGGGYSGESP